MCPPCFRDGQYIYTNGKNIGRCAVYAPSDPRIDAVRLSDAAEVLHAAERLVTCLGMRTCVHWRIRVHVLRARRNGGRSTSIPAAYLEVVEVLSGARALRDYRDLYAR